MNETITALRKQSRKSGDIMLEHVSLPAPGPHQALVRTSAVGLCGSDIHAVHSAPGYEWLPEQFTLGHEAVGRIVAVGDGVARSRLGERVVPLAIDGCRNCDVCDGGAQNLCQERNCMGLAFDGALADYFVLEADRLVRVGEELPDRVLAVTEPAAVAAHAVGKLGAEIAGKRIVVSGPGPVGLLCAFHAQDAGAVVELVGPDFGPQERLEFAQRNGLSTVRGHDLLDQSRPIDGWIESSGAAAVLEAAVRNVRRGGQVVVPGLFGHVPQLDINVLVRNEVRLQGTYGYVEADYTTATRLLTRRLSEIETMITTFPLADALTALEQTSGTSVIKAVVLMPVNDIAQGQGLIPPINTTV
jgi:L-iditol 2-dehydrogenase